MHPARRDSYNYTLPYRRKVLNGFGKTIKAVARGLVAVGASYVALKIVVGIFGFVWSAVSFLLPLGILSAAAYGALQWLKSR